MNTLPTYTLNIKDIKNTYEFRLMDGENTYYMSYAKSPLSDYRIGTYLVKLGDCPDNIREYWFSVCKEHNKRMLNA